MGTGQRDTKERELEMNDEGRINNEITAMREGLNGVVVGCDPFGSHSDSGFFSSHFSQIFNTNNLFFFFLHISQSFFFSEKHSSSSLLQSYISASLNNKILINSHSSTKKHRFGNKKNSNLQSIHTN